MGLHSIYSYQKFKIKKYTQEQTDTSGIITLILILKQSMAKAAADI